MNATTRKSLDEYLAMQYPFNVIADPDGGYVIAFPDLPGCMTQVEEVGEIATMAEEARRLWIESAYEQNLEIRLPSYPDEYSGKFNVRLPKSLHRSLAESADREGMSLNQYILYLLSRRDAQASLERRVEEVSKEVQRLQAGDGPARSPITMARRSRRSTAADSTTPQTTRRTVSTRAGERGGA